MTLSPADIPVIPRGVRLHFDKVRELWVLLAPERAINLDPIGYAIMTEIDSVRGFEAITKELSRKYNAPEQEIARDAGGFIATLMERRILELAS